MDFNEMKHEAVSFKEASSSLKNELWKFIQTGLSLKPEILSFVGHLDKWCVIFTYIFGTLKFQS